MKQLRFTVTEDDIKNGRPHSYSFCPIALAIKRTTRSLWVNVYGDVANVSIDRYRTTRSARKFIHRFDTGGSVKSQSFRFPVDAY